MKSRSNLIISFVILLFLYGCVYFGFSQVLLRCEGVIDCNNFYLNNIANPILSFVPYVLGVYIVAFLLNPNLLRVWRNFTFIYLIAALALIVTTPNNKSVLASELGVWFLIISICVMSISALYFYFKDKRKNIDPVTK